MEKAFSYRAAIETPIEGLFVLPAMTATKPKTTTVRPRIIPWDQPELPFPLPAPGPQPDPACGPRFRSQLFLNFQLPLSVQEPRNQMARASSQAWGPPNQL